MARVSFQSTLGSPATVLAQPNASSIRVRMRRLMS